MAKLHVFIINGRPGAGKDTFVKFLQDLYKGNVYNHSTVDSIKKIYKICGWNGEKTRHDRKVLSDLKDYMSQKIDLSFYEISEKISELTKKVEVGNEDLLLFIHIREPEEIERVIKQFPGTQSILISRPKKGKKQNNLNHADANVNRFEYDHYIQNNEGLTEFKKTAAKFLETISPEREFIIPIQWKMYGEFKTKAKSKEEAIDKLYKKPVFECDGSYLSHSLKVEINESKEEAMARISKTFLLKKLIGFYNDYPGNVLDAVYEYGSSAVVIIQYALDHETNRYEIIDSGYSVLETERITNTVSQNVF